MEQAQYYLPNSNIMPTEIAALRNVSKTYRNGTKALREFSLAIRKGECLVLLGPNGAGKTTAIKILTGILSADHGEVFVKGKKFSAGDPEQRIFGVALQEAGLWPLLTVGETLAFLCRLYGMKNGEIAARVKELLHQFQIEKIERRRVEQLSEGLKRRLNLACAFLHHPEILILDEPSLGLDVRTREALWEFLEQLRARNPLAFLLSTHDMEEAVRFGDRIGILDHGKLLALDSSQNLLSNCQEKSSGLKNLFLRLTGGLPEAQESAETPSNSE